MKAVNKRTGRKIRGNAYGISIEGIGHALDFGERRWPLADVRVVEMSYGEAIALERQYALTRDEIQAMLDDAEAGEAGELAS